MEIVGEGVGLPSCSEVPALDVYADVCEVPHAATLTAKRVEAKLICSERIVFMRYPPAESCDHDDAILVPEQGRDFSGFSVFRVV
ncbi:MAG: hypothetical protein RL189_2405 [Pseudomonadota bacterium]|jgi:hypothetical protein